MRRALERLRLAPRGARLLVPLAAILPALLAAGRVAAAEGALVEVAEVRSGAVDEELRLTGSVTAERHAQLSTRASGLVAEVRVDAGDRVEQGEVLLELDDSIARLAVESARASLEEARARLAEAERLRSEAAQLLRKSTIAETEAEARTAAARVAAAAVRRLEATLREQEERLARHRLPAPFAGVVARKLTEVGEWVETGTPVLELVDVDRLRLDVQVPQERFPDVGPETPVAVRLDALSGEEIRAEVAVKVPVTDPTARTFLLRIAMPDGVDAASPGMSGRATLRLPVESSAPLVPRDAVLRSADGGSTVWIVERVGDETRARRRPVRLGRNVGTLVEVRDGLVADDTVVVRGNETLREGQTVRVVETGEQEAAARDAPGGRGS